MKIAAIRNIFMVIEAVKVLEELASIREKKHNVQFSQVLVKCKAAAFGPGGVDSCGTHQPGQHLVGHDCPIKQRTKERNLQELCGY